MARGEGFVGDFLRSAPRRVALASAVVAGAALAEGVGIILLVPLIVAIGGVDGGAAAGIGGGGGGRVGATAAAVLDGLGVEDRAMRLVAIVAAFAVLMIVRAALLSWRQTLLATLELDYLARIQRQLVDRLAAARWERIARLRHARVTQVLGGDVAQIGQAAVGLLQSLVAVVMLAVQVLLALWLAPVLTLVAIALVAVGALLARGVLGAARSTGQALIGLRMTLLDDTAQFLGALKLSASQNLQHRFATDVAQTLAEANAREIAFVAHQNRIRVRLTLVAGLVGGAVAWLGFSVLAVAPATVVVLLLILSRMSAPAALLQSQAIAFVRAMPAYRNLRALEADLGAPSPAGAAAAAPRGDIVFRDVSYRHGGGGGGGGGGEGGGGLSGLSLTIAQGQSLGIAGASGAGKTTFADLLVGLYAPAGGAIEVGGAAVDLATLPAWRDRLSYVSQDPFLLHASIRDNLRWGTDADEAAMHAVLAVVGAAALVARLPEGLDTVVGERGALLSGGERQRLAIARALLRHPALLILDEATNAIDVAGEAALLARLESLKPALTIVSIAHRAETLARCDRIAVLAGGRVVATGDWASVAHHAIAAPAEVGLETGAA